MRNQKGEFKDFFDEMIRRGYVRARVDGRLVRLADRLGLDRQMRHDIEIEHSCGGFCACSTCHVIVEDGGENLSEMSEDEEDRLDTAAGLTLRSRLGCQSEILRGPVTLRIGPSR